MARRVYNAKIGETYTMVDEKTGERKRIRIETKISAKELVIWVEETGKGMVINPQKTKLETTDPA